MDRGRREEGGRGMGEREYNGMGGGDRGGEGVKWGQVTWGQV